MNQYTSINGIAFGIHTIIQGQKYQPMLFNYLKIASRQLWKQKYYTLINIFGLAISIACCLMILLYIKHELSYDQHHSKADQIYRLVTDINLNNSEVKGLAMPFVLAQTLASDYSEVELAARFTPYFRNGGSNILKVEGQADGVFQDHFVYIDQDFTEIFDFTEKYGDPSTWLEAPNTVVITEEVAQRFFGQENPVGKNLILNDDPESQKFTITGVIQNPPSTSHINYDYYLSMETLRDVASDNWLFNNFFTYIQLKEGTDIEAFNQKLEQFSLKYFAPAFKEQMNIDLLASKDKGEKYQLYVQPLKDIHLHSSEMVPIVRVGGNIQYIRMFGLVGLFILIIAIINFVNLATARSANRAKEVGIRKVLGSRRKQLTGQFLTESSLISAISTGGSLLLTLALLPFFNNLAGTSLSLPFTSYWFIPGLLLFVLIMGVLSGFYPALYLSGFKPIEVLKGLFVKGKGNQKFRQSLVIFQFAISSALIIGSLTVFYQMRFMYKKNIGFDKDRILRIEDSYILGENEAVFKQELKNLPEVKHATISPYLPLEGGYRNSIAFYIEGEGEPEDQVPVQFWPIDEDYLSTLGIELKSGRNFASDRPGDSIAVIINEAVAAEFNVEDPVGKRLKSSFIEQPYKIIGVVKDFNYEHLKGKVEPLAFTFSNPRGTIAIKAETGTIASLAKKAEKIWQSFAPGLAFRYTFLDERFDRMYAAENRTAQLLQIFTGLAIFIASLGLLGLATFTAEQRTKEIGIRKVLGASVAGIVKLLSKDFLKLVVIGVGIASPIAYYIMEQWLQDFAHRIHISWWIFIVAALGALCIAFITISYQSIKAALSNPIHALRNE